MKAQDKIEYLEQYQKTKRQIDRLNLQLEELRTAKMFPSANIGDGMPHAHENKDLSDYAVNIDEQISKILKLQKRNQALLIDITNAINDMDSENEKDVLHLRYVIGMKWEQIGTYMNYSRQQVTRFHRDGIEHFAPRKMLHNVTKGCGTH